MTTSPNPPLRMRVEWAARAARSVVTNPSLCFVEVEHGAGSADPADVVYCGFQHERRSWFGRALLDICRVRVAGGADTAAVMSHGTFPRHQYRRMAAVKEYPCPPRPLDLNELAIEPAEARAAMLHLVAAEGATEPVCLGTGLTIQEGVLAWHGIVERPGHDVHTIRLDAKTGAVLAHTWVRLHNR